MLLQVMRVMLACAELCAALSDAKVMHANANSARDTGRRVMLRVDRNAMQCHADVDTVPYDAMSGELTDSTLDSLGYRPKELTDSSLYSSGYRPEEEKCQAL